MKKLEDFLVTGLNEQVGSEPIRPAMLSAYTKKYIKQGLDPTQAQQAATEELEKYRELGRMGFHGGKQSISAGPQFDMSTEQGKAEKAAYDTGKSLMGAIQFRDKVKEIGMDLEPDYVESFAQKARDANAEANRLQRSAQRISPMYDITQGEFQRLTGTNYDAMNREHQRLFFDINARRKQGFGDFGTPEAMYDVVDGQLAATTPESRKRARSQEDDNLARQRIDAEMASKDEAIRTQAGKNVAGELALDYVKNWGQPDTQRDQSQISPDENTGGMNATGSIEDFERTQAQPPAPWALGVEKQLNKYRAKSTKEQMPVDTDEGPVKYGVGPVKHQESTYVVPGSQAWAALDQDQKMAMTIAALQRGEAHKFFGGREQTTGGFLGMGGKKTGRFSVDTSDQNANQIARQLNAMLDEYDAKATAQQKSEATPVVSAAVQTGAGMGIPNQGRKGFQQSNLPANVADLIARFGNKKFSTRADMPK